MHPLEWQLASLHQNGPARIGALLQGLELLGWTACRNVEIDVRLGYATAAVKNNSLRPEPPVFRSSAICYVILRPG